MKKLLILITAVFALQSLNAQTKYVLLEEVTGGWCQYCTGGTYYMDSITKMNPYVIGIAVHGGDPMENTTYLNGTGLTSYPSANIDRGNQGASIGSWFSTVAAAQSATPAAGIEVFTYFNPSTRLLTTRVKATFTTAVTGTYKLGAIIVEDGVHGTSSQWNQSNKYSGGALGPMGGFEHLPSSIPGNMLAYNHVGREILGGYDGQSGSVPASVSAGDTVSYTFTHTLPNDWDEDYIKVVGLLFDTSNGIENAGKSDYLDGNSNAKPLFMSDPNTTAYVGNPYVFDIYCSDPDDYNLTVTGVGLPSWLSLSSPAPLGMIHTKVTLSGTPTAIGNHPVKIVVSDGSRTDTLSFTINVASSQPGNWQLLGTQGFTSANFLIDMKVANDGTIYAFVENNGYNNVWKKTSTGTWTQVGNLNGVGYHGRLAIAADGTTPYVAYSDMNPVTVKKFDGTNWVQIGGTFAGGVQLGMDLDNNNNVYVAMQDGTNNYKGNCYTFDGTNWIKLGGTSYSGSNAGVWNDVKVNRSTGDVYVLWNKFTGGKYSTVSKWDGTSWTDLGGGYVTTDEVLFNHDIEINESTGEIYVVIAQESGSSAGVGAYKWDGTSWSNIGNNISNGEIEDLSACINSSGALLVAFSDLNYSGNVSAMSYYNGSWSYIGPQGFSNAMGGSCLIDAHQNMPYVAYKDGSVSDMVTVKYYDYPISVNEIIKEENSLTLYPNPASNSVTLEGLEGSEEVRIFNIDGSLVWSGQMQNGDKINTSDFNSGLYIVKLKHTVQRLVILN